MIIGISPGRSGSSSFSRWLNIMHEFKTLHSKFYHQDRENWLARMKYICDTYDKTEGDVSWAHILCIDEWIESGATVVGLVRDRDEVVDSWLRRGAHRPMQRLFSDHDLTTKEGLEKFIDWFNDELFKREKDIIIISPEQIPRRDNTWSSYEAEAQRRGIEQFDESARDNDNNGVIFDFTDGKEGEPL